MFLKNSCIFNRLFQNVIYGRSVFLTFFLSECCMAQRLRCPGGRPFCQLQKIWKCRYLLDIKNQLKATTNQTTTQTNHNADSQRVQGGRVVGGLFHAQSIKG